MACCRREFFAAVLAVQLFLIALASQAGAYTDHSLSVSILLRPDGTAHVAEKTVFSFDNDNESREANFLLSSARSVTQLSRLSQNVKFHVGNATVPRTNIRVTVRPEYEVASSARAILLEYDLGKVVSNETRGRLTTFVFSQDVLEFEKTESKQMVLGPIMELSVEIPKGSRLSLKDREYVISPKPDSVSGNTVVWSGKNIGTGFWFLQYENEMPLSQEVYEYFLGLYEKASASAPLLILAALVAVVLLILVKFGKPKAGKE